MSASAPTAVAPRPGFAARAPLLYAGLVALALLAISLVPMAVEAIDQGRLFDADDAMRLVQMREWIDGKGWYDLTEHRLDPPEGMVSHWPRLIEAPMAAAIHLMAPWLGRDLAERIVVATWPGVLLAALVLGMLALAARLFTPPALLAGALILGLSPLLIFQFAPGRIDHHGAQMLLAFALAAATVIAVTDKRRVAAWGAGMVAGLMMAIGLETLPVVAVAAMVFGAAWIVEGEPSRPVVRAFGLSFALAAPAFFAISIPPARWIHPVCDALSPSWLLLSCGGGLVLVGLSASAPKRPMKRAAIAFLSGGAVTAIFAALFPHCLSATYPDLDPVVRKLWMNDVGEANATLPLVAADPETLLYFVAFPLIGVIALGVASFTDRRRAPFLILLAFSLVTLIVAIFAMRGASFAAIFGFFGWLWLVDRGLAAKTTAPLRASLALVILIVALPFPWSTLGAAVAPAPVPAIDGTCDRRADMASLAREPQGLVLALPRLGPRILVATHHDVLAAPYHRNNRGNRFALETLTDDPATAHARIAERGVRYVAICTADPDLVRLSKEMPDSLLAMLADDSAPAWLTPLAAADTIRAWRVTGWGLRGALEPLGSTGIRKGA